MSKRKRGQKICENCGCVNGVRAYECKECDHPFKMKKWRKGNKRKPVEDHTTLQKGDLIRVVGGSGSYHTDYNGEKTYLVDRGKYTVHNTDLNGIHAYGKTGYNYLYMGESCPSPLLSTITKAPCKIVLLKSVSHVNHVSSKRSRSRR